jgi:methylenetetrahydrofolate dehydrogenase (NADP+)/methenyltetrahydrofolate cyclohydrolase
VSGGGATAGGASDGEAAGAKLIDGKAEAAAVRAEVAADVESRVAAGARKPGLATILVGDDPASAVYVARKIREAGEVGMNSEHRALPADVSMQELLAVIEDCNRDEGIDGIIVQLPLPAQLDEDAAVAAVDPTKDVDGLHPVNQGALFTGRPGPRPCTPVSCVHLMDTTGVDLAGLHAVVVGRSALVGKPVSMLLLERHATVVLCHSRTADLQRQVESADVLVVAIGSPRAIPGEWVKPGSVVIDVGINRVDGRLVGDIDFDVARQRAAYITPVPGGVGPMTVAVLLRNTRDAWLASLAAKSAA